ncbi:MAG: hypothetical protein M3388_08285 [Acidobacteriota bacterium]|nr:hypothetical protein [Acidobacteriota bacterium]
MTNDILSKLKAPAICLILTGALNGLISILTLLGGVARFAGIGGRESLPTRDAERFGFYVGTLITYGSGLLALIVASIIIYGAIQMMKGRKLGLAKASAILAIVPFTSCCFLIGIPVGIWALTVLGKPDVKAVFRGENLPPNFNPPQPPSF